MRCVRFLVFVSLTLCGIAGPCTAQALWDRTPLPPADDNARMVFDSRTGREAYVLLVRAGKFIEVWEYPLATRKWIQRTPPVRPNVRVEFAAAFDAARGVTVMFGGGDFSPKKVTDEVWEWDGNTWERRSPKAGPSARKRCHAVYHIGRREVVIYAGTDTKKQLDDLWGYNGTSWTLLASGTTKPRPRNDAALAYDSKRGEILMFGGYIGKNAFDNETWRWTKTGWQKLPALTSPSPRGWHSLVYDPVRDRTLLLGQYLLWNNHETWEFDRARLRWTRVSTNPPGGIRRENPSLCYDPIRRRVMTFGGNANYGSGFSDQWGPRADLHGWDATNSRWLAEAGTLPDPDAAYEMAYDPSRKAMVLAGFWWNGPTWQRIGGQWIARAHARPTPFPKGREWFDIAYGGGGETILFGGRNSANGSSFAETWRFNGSRWQKLSPKNSPPARSTHEMVTVRNPTTGKDQVLLFGGEDRFRGTPKNDLWSFDGTNWSQVSAGSTWPPPLAGFALAAGVAGTEVLLFGGRTTGGARSNQTWRYRVGTSKWQLLLPKQSPPQMNYVEMTYDAALGAYVLMANDGKVWTFSGTDWTLRTKCERPRPSNRAAMAYDPTVRKVRSFGGDEFGVRGEEWLLDMSGLGRLESFGAGCAGGVSIPKLVAPNRPRIGQSFAILVQPATSGSVLAIGLSSSRWGSVPLPIRLERDCWLQVSPDIFLSGGSSYKFQIPQSAGLRGSCLVVQALAPQSGRVAMTPPSRLILGN
jgi:Galactose oxidase, central domain